MIRMTVQSYSELWYLPVRGLHCACFELDEGSALVLWEWSAQPSMSHSRAEKALGWDPRRTAAFLRSPGCSHPPGNWRLQHTQESWPAWVPSLLPLIFHWPGARCLQGLECACRPAGPGRSWGRGGSLKPVHGRLLRAIL